MKAVVIHAARDLRVEEREPEAPGAGQVEIAIEAGGICGSDLHYFNHGGFGTVRVREPMILGHEVAGTSRRWVRLYPASRSVTASRFLRADPAIAVTIA